MNGNVSSTRLDAGSNVPRRIGPDGEELPRWAILAPLVAGSLGASIGVWALTGWALDAEALRAVLPGQVPMEANTAACFIMLGTALVLLAPMASGHTRRLVGRLLALAAASVGLLRLGEHVFGRTLGIDHALFGGSSGRMSTTTALGFLLMGVALASFANAPTRRIRQLLDLAFASVAVLSLTSVVSYLYGARSVDPSGGAGAPPTAVPTAIVFLVLALGARLARPSGVVALALKEGLGGVIVRRFAPTAGVSLLAAGYLRLWGERAGWFGPGAGTALFVVSVAVVSTLAISSTARTVERAELARRRAEDEGQLFFDLTLDMMCLANLDGYFVQLNPAWERTLGWSVAELKARPFIEFVHPEDQEATIAEAARLGLGANTVSFENRYRCKDGSYRWLVWTAAGVPDRGLLIATARDVTERRLSEDALRRSEAFLDSVVENVPHMLFIKDADELRFVRFNRAGEELLGYSRKDLIGKNDHDFFPQEEADFFTSKDREVLEHGELLDIPEEPIETKTGLRYLHTRKVPVLDESGRPRYLLGISEDITEWKRTREQLHEAKEEAERANHAKDEFLSRMSHELRTPLNAVIGFAQILELDGLAAEQLDSVKQILSGGRHLLSLIDEILDISRIATGHLTLSPEPVGLNAALREAVDLVQPIGADRRISLRAEDANGLHVLADRQRLQQVLLNLLSNAVKYNREGGEVSVTWEKAPPDGLLIKVADTGPGIPADMMDRLFVPFDRLGAESTGVGGTGLGLALSRGLVESMGGSIHARNRPGTGAEFVIALRLAEPPSERYERELHAEDFTRGAAPDASTVLYIEDNLSNLTLIERIFAGRPHIKLLSAMQGRLGIELAREHGPDLILLDLHLPDIPGEEALRRLREDPLTRRIPVIIISADATHGQIKRLLAAGADHYLTKPLDVRRFLEVMEGMLQRDGASR